MKKVVINGIDLKDFKLVYESHNFLSPVPKTDYIDIPYGNGSLDLTEAIVPFPVYSMREGTISMGVMLGTADFDETEIIIKNKFLGKKAVVVIDDGWENIGRVTDIVFNHEYGFLKVIFSFVFNPYKLKPELTTITRSINGTEVIQIENASMPARAKLTTDNPIDLKIGASSYSFSQGTHTVRDLLMSGTNSWEFTGNANISIEWQEGEL